MTSPRAPEGRAQEPVSGFQEGRGGRPSEIHVGRLQRLHGGGGMGPLLTNQVWVYGSDDDTLFRLISLGSD
jgi:hypothetical protein